MSSHRSQNPIAEYAALAKIRQPKPFCLSVEEESDLDFVAQSNN